MSNKPIVVVRRTGQSDDELYHWKYIDKIKLPGGGFRYVYEQAKNTVGNAIGINQKNAYNQASQNMAVKRSAMNNANRIANNTRNSYIKTEADSHTKLVKELQNPSLFGHNKKVQKLNETRLDAQEQQKKATRLAENTSKAYRESVSDYNKKKEAYDNSLLGKLDKAGDSAKRFIDNTGKKAKKGLSDAAKEVSTWDDKLKDKLGFDEKDAYREASRNYDVAKGAASSQKSRVAASRAQKEEAGLALNKANNTPSLFKKSKVEKATQQYEDAKSNLEKSKNVSYKLHSKQVRAGEELAKKTAAYYNTPMGKIDKAGKTITNGMNKVANLFKKKKRR